jgi:transcriptional regulator with XRE-family HTH domain
MQENPENALKGAGGMRMRITELACRQKGWTMKKLADAMGVEHQTVMYWNQGRAFPRLPMLIRLCRLLGCKLDDMIEA